MLNQRFHTNHPTADQTAIDALIDDMLHHKRQSSEDSGLGEGKSRTTILLYERRMHHCVTYTIV
jgi:hypothetical protein